MKASDRWCRLISLVTNLAPLLLLVTAVAGGPSGYDPERSWGPIRVGMLLVGVGGTFAVVVSQVIQILEGRWKSLPREKPVTTKASRSLQDPSEIEDISISGPSSSLLGSKSLIWLMPLLIAIEALYVFIASAGHGYPWPETTSYYDLLAGGFADGRLSLSIEPDPRLAQIDNPYSISERGNIPILTDASYFKGSYYLYWGPVPAGAITALKLALGWSVGDHYVVFVALNAILLFSILILDELRKVARFYVPPWLWALSIFFVATVHPVLWVLGWPSIYPAAIASGQAFLLAGIYFALPLLENPSTSAGRPILAGGLWALALGSRLSLIVAVASLLAAIAIAALRRARRAASVRTAGRTILLIGLPVTLGLALIGVYNFARFGNIFETGLQYQLSRLDLGRTSEAGSLFSLRYLIPNAAYYLGSPLRFRSSFPFIRPFFEEIPLMAALARWFAVPADHHVENIAGLLFTAPAIGLLAVYVKDLICGAPQTRLASQSGLGVPSDRGKRLSFSRTIFLLTIVAISGSLPALMYFWITNRFLLDSVPLLAISSAASSWQIFSTRSHYPLRRYFTAFVLFGLVGLGFLVSLLLSMTGTASRFDDLNPELWQLLDRLLSR